LQNKDFSYFNVAVLSIDRCCYSSIQYNAYSQIC